MANILNPPPYVLVSHLLLLLHHGRDHVQPLQLSHQLLRPTAIYHQFSDLTNNVFVVACDVVDVVVDVVQLVTSRFQNARTLYCPPSNRVVRVLSCGTTNITDEVVQALSDIGTGKLKWWRQKCID
ncbi:hypothetical protein J6590_031494 [Homalodisca vitripennis]|nr:hypothetical protein J6590_031494 [Homalodisca vitripennis]